MAPVLTVTFGVAAAGMFYAVALLGAYGLGHCSVIVCAGTFTGVVQRYLNWNERSAGAKAVKRVCGVLVILGGAYLIYSVSSFASR
jgi:cytochrome c-type biogenesis protein